MRVLQVATVAAAATTLSVLPISSAASLVHPAERRPYALLAAELSIPPPASFLAADPHGDSHGHGDAHGGHDTHVSHDTHDSHDHAPITSEPKGLHHEDHHDKILEDAHGHAKDTHHGDAHGDGHAKAGHGDGHGDAHGGHTVHGGDHIAHGGHGKHSSEAKSVAVGLVGAVVLIPAVMYMALSGGVLAELTLRMLDTFVSIFLAVLWFNTFAQFLETFEVNSFFPHAAEVFSLIQVVVLYLIANFVAFLWRDKTIHLTTFTTCGAHFIAFAGIGCSGTTQYSISKVGDEMLEPYVLSFGFCIFVIGCIIGVATCNFFAWRNKVEHEKMNEAIDELELDILGLVVSFLITQAVRHALTGRYPPLHLLFTQFSVDAASGPHFKHETWQIWFMLGYSVSLTILTAVMLPKLSQMSLTMGYWGLKGIHVVKVLLVMLTAWAYLLWGDWAFFDLYFQGGMMFGRMVFACLATLACLGVLCLLAYLDGRFHASGSVEYEFEESESVAIVCAGISLVAAWSWEHTFNVAFDIIGEEFQVGYKGLVPKLFLAIIIPLSLLPTYIVHVRRRVLAIAEEREEKFLERRHSLGGGSPHSAEVIHVEPEVIDSGRRRPAGEAA